MPRINPEVNLLLASCASDDSNLYLNDYDDTSPVVSVMKKSEFAQQHHPKKTQNKDLNRQIPLKASTIPSREVADVNGNEEEECEDDDGYVGIVRHRKQKDIPHGTYSNTGEHFRLNAARRQQEQDHAMIQRKNRQNGVRSPILSPKIKSRRAGQNKGDFFASKIIKIITSFLTDCFSNEPSNARLPEKKVLQQHNKSSNYYTKFDMIANRPRRVADRILYRYRRQPLLKGYLIFLILVELLVIYNFSIDRQPAHVACSWLTKGFPTGVQDLETPVWSAAAQPRQAMFTASPVGDAAFIAMFMCLVIPRVLLYLFYENIAVAGLAAIVHIAEIFHFWSLGAIKKRVDNVDWKPDQYVVFGFILANSFIFARHFFKICQFYCGRVTDEEQSAFEELALSSTESLQEALKRKAKWRKQREEDTDTLLSFDGQSSPNELSPYNRTKRRAKGEVRRSNFPASSPTELYIRPHRSLSRKAYKRIQYCRLVLQRGGIIAWNLMSAIGFMELAFGFYVAVPYVAANKLDPFFFSNVESEDGSQVLMFICGFVALSHLISATLPWCKKTHLFSNPSPSFFEDSEEEEAFHVMSTDPAHKKGAIVAARLPVALIGICTQLFIAYPLRSAAIHALKLLLSGEDGFGSDAVSSRYNRVYPSTSIFSSIFNTYLFVPIFDTFSFFSISSYFITSMLYTVSMFYTFAYVVAQLVGTGLLTSVWVKVLDFLL